MKITENSHLFIIGLQNDYIDRSFGNNYKGSKSILNSRNYINIINGFTEKYASKFKKIYFIKDYHPFNHHSFKCNGGTLPTHCVQASQGAKLVDEMINLYNIYQDKSIILFKGIVSQYYSYSVVHYDNDEYAKKMQRNIGCKIELINKYTGCFALNNQSDEINNDIIITLHNSYQYMYENILDGEDIYLLGVLGDTVIKDSAIYLKKLKPLCNVYIIDNLTAYDIVSIDQVIDNKSKVRDYIVNNNIYNYNGRVLTIIKNLNESFISFLTIMYKFYYTEKNKKDDIIKDYEKYNIKLIYL